MDGSASVAPTPDLGAHYENRAGPTSVAAPKRTHWEVAMRLIFKILKAIACAHSGVLTTGLGPLTEFAARDR